MIDPAPNLIFRDLRRDPSLAPGGARFPDVVQKFLPMVYGAATASIPENPVAAESVADATFQTLAIRWKKPARKTLVAAWLLRTVWYAIARERSRLGLKAKAATPEGYSAQTAIKKLIGLSPKYAEPLILAHIFGEPLLPKMQKRAAVGLRKIQKPVSKIAAIDAATLLRGLNGPPPLETAILAKAASWTPAANRSELVQSTLSAWRWLAVGKFFKRALATFASIAMVLVALGFTFAFLFEQGYLMPFFMQMEQQKLVKDFPEIDDPGRPWPTTPEHRALVSPKAPTTPAELYVMTNIWVAKLTFTPDQWDAVKPARVKPVKNLMENGRIKLRNPEASRSGLAGALGIDFRWSQAAFEFADAQFAEVGVRIRGNGTYVDSLHGEKRSFKVDLNRVKKNQELAGETTLNFVNSVSDFTYMKDALAERLFRDLGAVAPRTTYAYLTIDVPGIHDNRALGLYVLIEDIDGNFAKDRFGTKATPIFKPVTYDLFQDWGDDWEKYREIYDLKTKATEEQLARVVEFAKIVTHATDEEFAKKLPDYLDFEEYAGFVAGHVLMSSYDGYLCNGQNFYMYLDPRSNKFGFIPWDQDHGWGEFGLVSTAEKRENASIWKPAAYDNKFLKRVLKVEAFREVYRKKFEQALAGPFTVEYLNREIDFMANLLRPAVAAESSFRIERFETAISTNWVSGPRDGDFNQGTAIGVRAPAHQLKRFIEARTKSVRDQLDGKSTGDVITGFGQPTHYDEDDRPTPAGVTATAAKD